MKRNIGFKSAIELSLFSSMFGLCSLSATVSATAAFAGASQPSIAPFGMTTERSFETLDRTRQQFDRHLARHDRDLFEGAIAQVTSVSQLSDVQPTDWAFQALQSLVERYGCIAGYPDGTYRGNRPLSRYEFAAGMNACLDQILNLIEVDAEVSEEDLAVIRRLQEEFAAELATLRGRVDALEARTAELEANQFSTTTKLNGQVIFSLAQGFGGAPDGDDSQTIFTNRVRLNLTTSFTGSDLLITGLQSHNFGGSALTGEGSIQGELFPDSALNSGMTRLSFEPQFAGFDPKDLGRSTGNNDVEIYKLLYLRPVTDALTVFVAPAVEVSDAFPAITPFADEGREAISRFAGYNPVVRVSGGTSGTGLASAAGFILGISDGIDWRALYGSVNANLPGAGDDVLPGVSINPLGAGVFSGSYVAATQLTLKPIDSLDIGLNYAHSYHEINILGTGLSRASANVLAGLPLGVPVNVNSVGGTLTWRFTPQIALSGYGAAFFVDDSSGRFDASSTLTSWMAGLHFRDLLGTGDSAGLIFGQPLYITDTDGDADRDAGLIDRSTPYHLEGYYRFQASDNISITPGAIVLFSPEGDSENDTTVVGVLRTTFEF
ncbi:MAG: iron uptake porin [Cyanobacteriota bacterium]|nr:iron uptake porin [Cyanobacteriota bacterium]